MPRIVRWTLLLAACCAWPVAAVATPVTYAFQSGTASVDVEVDGSLVQSVSTPLSGTFVTFDAMAPAITDLEYLIQDSIDLGSLLGTLDVDIVVEDGVGFSAPATPVGGGSYTYSGGPLQLSALVTLSGGSLGFWNHGGTPITIAIDPVDGTVDVTGNTAHVVTQKQLSFGFVPFVGHDVVVTAKVDFFGVPEPATAALLLVGAIALAGLRRRARAV